MPEGRTCGAGIWAPDWGVNCQHLELAGQNFGFELAEGVTQVELEPGQDHYYMEVQLKEES